MNWAEIIGHPRPKKILEEALTRPQMAHAYLFHGEESIGKLLTARAFAQAMVCSDQDSQKPFSGGCGHCQACRSIESETHPDIRIIQPDGSQMKIDQIRTIKEMLAFKPLNSPQKIIILNNVESMTPQASNSFLKTLEEPPDHSLLILITSQPHRLLPTIVSRCQQIRFDSPSREEMTRLLMERKGLSELEAGFLAALSMGKIGYALTTDQTSLKEQRDETLDILFNKTCHDLDQLLNKAQSHAVKDETFRTTMNWIMILLRDTLIYQHNPDPKLLINLDRKEDLARFSQRLSTPDLLKIMTLLIAFQQAAHRNLNRTLVLETILLSLRACLKEVAS